MESALKRSREEGPPKEEQRRAHATHLEANVQGVRETMPAEKHNPPAHARPATLGEPHECTNKCGDHEEERVGEDE